MQVSRNIQHFATASISVRKVRVGLITVLYSLFSILSNAQVTATFKGDSTQIEIGDHLHMKLVVNARPDYLVAFPQFGDSLGPNIEIIGKDKVEKVALGGDTIYTQNVVISAYEEGRYFINPLKIYTKNKSTGAVDSIYTNDFQLIVTTVKVDTTKPIRPIKAPLKVDYKLNEFTWWIVAAVVLLVAAIIGFILYRRYKNKPAPVAARPRPKDPAHIWANKELKKLDQERLWQAGDVKLYHSKLTDIIRLYLEYRFNYYAMEATTEEIMTKAYGLDINMETGARLRAILSLADFVKFAKMNPAPDQNSKSMQDALDFVEMTKPVEEVIIPAKK
jgi:hypothetical protein